MQTNRQKSAFRTTIGGQALIEGILMRGPEKQAIVVRRPDGGLEVRVEELRLIKERYPILGWPFIRGVVTFLDSMIRGVKALMFSADFYPEEEAAQPSKFELWLEEKLGSEKFSQIIVGLAVVLGVSFSIGLFFLLPAALTGLLQIWVPMSRLAVSAVEGVIRVLLFLAYLIFCSRLSDIRRVFSYHGAEHKTIFCYEKGLPLTVENVRVQPRHHPRCGTSFLFVVIVVAILISSVVFSFVNVTNVLARMGLHLLMLPVVVGITYEINRYVGRHDGGIAALLTRPGLWMQNFTTFEPDDSMIEVGIRSLELVLPSEKGKDAW